MRSRIRGRSPERVKTCTSQSSDARRSIKQAAEVQQAASGLQVHHQVNGTAFGVFLPEDWPDDRNVRRTTSCRNGEELLAAAAEVRQMGELSHVGIVP